LVGPVDGDDVSLYFALKTLHILTATLIFGTGLGSVYYLWSAHRARDLAALRFATRHVVAADWIFTTPSIVLQPATGVWLMVILGYRFDSAWFAAVGALYVLAGACWVPVVVIQYRLRELAAETASSAALPERYFRLMRVWGALGAGAFAAVLALFALMVFRPGL
jgi:uncharacterized membrane protein